MNLMNEIYFEANKLNDIGLLQNQIELGKFLNQNLIIEK
jgi:hypothetical protein